MCQCGKSLHSWRILKVYYGANIVRYLCNWHKQIYKIKYTIIYWWHYCGCAGRISRLYELKTFDTIFLKILPLSKWAKVQLQNKKTQIVKLWKARRNEWRDFFVQFIGEICTSLSSSNIAFSELHSMNIWTEQLSFRPQEIN